jgi:hypothetical protein
MIAKQVRQSRLRPRRRRRNENQEQSEKEKSRAHQPPAIPIVKASSCWQNHSARLYGSAIPAAIAKNYLPYVRDFHFRATVPSQARL